MLQNILEIPITHFFISENLKKIEIPVILHILKDGNLEHYVVCYGYEDGKFILGDPGRGNYRIPRRRIGSGMEIESPAFA